MEYRQLTKAYRDSQIERIAKSLSKIGQAENPDGRVIPDQDDLVIGKGRRLRLSVLFLDICGFSSWFSDTPEEQNKILSAFSIFFTEMVRVSEDYGGVVEKNTGDGLMVYFDGAGKTENTSVLAAGCALSMMSIAKSIINPVLAHQGIDTIDFRIGMDTGNVTLAKIGAPRRYNSVVAIGATANISCKMLNKAGRNQIVIGDTLRSELPEYWQAEYTKILLEDSGWSYRGNGANYPFYEYRGRWKEPI
ncbi:MAG: adenylate/guanylate cyclase domain-containing protein [Candidatus Reddybacter sp.]